MNKSSLSAAVHAATGDPKSTVNAVVSATIDAIADALRNGEEVKLPGLGTFKPKPVAERTRRNPQTGEPMTVPAHRAVKFKAGTAVRDVLRGGE